MILCENTNKLAVDETVKKANFYIFYIKSPTSVTHPEKGKSMSIQINETVILL